MRSTENAKALPSSQKWRIIIGGTIGNLTEWYTFLLFGYLSPVISTLFFPGENKFTALMWTFSILALSFFARPFGALLFGWIGDTFGRQRALLCSLIMMAIPSFLIGCLPTYQTIGILSPIFLCLLRITQGLSAGGELTGSAIYMAEYAPKEQRSLWVSTVPASSAFGLLASSVMSWFIVHHFTHDALLAGGWRIGYFAGAALCLISILLRLHLPETPDFENARNNNRDQHQSISSLIRNNHTLKQLLSVFSFASAWGILYQALFIWMPTYLTTTLGLAHSSALAINSFYIGILGCLILVIGFLGDYINRKLLVCISCSCMFIFSYPLFGLLSSGSIREIHIAMGIFTLIFSLYIPTSLLMMIDTFTVRTRYTGLSFSFNMGLAMFGGTCPLIATWIMNYTGNILSPAFYMMLASIVALINCAITTNHLRIPFDSSLTEAQNTIS